MSLKGGYGPFDRCDWGGLAEEDREEVLQKIVEISKHPIKHNFKHLISL